MEFQPFDNLTPKDDAVPRCEILMKTFCIAVYLFNSIEFEINIVVLLISQYQLRLCEEFMGPVVSGSCL